MSTKNNLKDRIKKPNPTQAFFNSYETDDNEKNNIDNLENIDIDRIESKLNNDIDNNEDIDMKDDHLNNNNNEIYVNNSIDVVVNDDENEYLRKLATGKKPIKQKKKKVFTSFYMDPDLAVEVEKIAARGQKGDKSKLMNVAIRRLLEEYGVIEKK